MSTVTRSCVLAVLPLVALTSPGCSASGVVIVRSWDQERDGDCFVGAGPISGPPDQARTEIEVVSEPGVLEVGLRKKEEGPYSVSWSTGTHEYRFRLEDLGRSWLLTGLAGVLKGDDVEDAVFVADEAIVPLWVVSPASDASVNKRGLAQALVRVRDDGTFTVSPR